MKKVIFPLLLVMVLAPGCAVGNTHNDHTSHLDLILRGTDTLTIGVQDHRPYIINHSKESTFVGLQRATFGNTWDMTTVSGSPLVQDFMKVIVNSFRLKNIQIDSLIIPSDMTPEQARALLLSKTSHKAIHLRIDHWKTDTYTNTALHDNVIAEVLEKNGDIVGQSQVVEVDDIGGSFWNPPSQAKQAVPQAYKRKLETLLNHPDILKALIKS